MGTFYTNTTIIGPTLAERLRFLKDMKWTAYVSATIAGISVVYDRQCDEQRIEDLHALSALISDHFQCRAASVLNHDDGVLFFAAYDRGNLVTEYESPAGREAKPMALCRLFGVSIWRAPLVWLALKRPHLLYLFESFRHRRLVRLLDLSELAVGTGYRYIDRGERPLDSDGGEAQVEHTLRRGDSVT